VVLDSLWNGVRGTASRRRRQGASSLPSNKLDVESLKHSRINGD
jgi:hypothetical protein